MQNKYTLSYVFQIISESEFEFSEDIIKFGMESWPITRNMLWTTLTNLKKENKIKKEMSEEKIFELATNAGANDCIFYDDYYEIHTNKDEIYDVKNIMEKEISNFISTEIEWVPINKIKLNHDDKEKMAKFLEILEEDDDVQNVFTNAI